MANDQITTLTADQINPADHQLEIIILQYNDGQICYHYWICNRTRIVQIVYQYWR